MSSLLLGPGLAVETLTPAPAANETPVTADRLPDKTNQRQAAAAEGRPTVGVRLFPGVRITEDLWNQDVPQPFEADGGSFAPAGFLAFRTTSNPLLLSSPVVIPAAAAFASESETENGPSGPLAPPAGEEELVADTPPSAPEAEIDESTEAPAEVDPEWQPADTPTTAGPEEGSVEEVRADAVAAEAAAANGAAAPGSGDNANLLPIEQRVGEGVITGEVSDATTLEPIGGKRKGSTRKGSVPGSVPLRRYWT